MQMFGRQGVPEGGSSNIKRTPSQIFVRVLTEYSTSAVAWRKKYLMHAVRIYFCWFDV